MQSVPDLFDIMMGVFQGEERGEEGRRGRKGGRRRLLIDALTLGRLPCFNWGCNEASFWVSGSMHVTSSGKKHESSSKGQQAREHRPA